MSFGAKTRLCGRFLWSPILLRIVDVESVWIRSKNFSDSHMVGKEYVIASKKHA